MKTRKIYCRYCRYLGSTMEKTNNKCLHPHNIGDWYSDEHLGRPLYKCKAKDLNANNDCAWFEPERRGKGK